jgi:methanogenic corrinoid protein MtbC1
MVAEALERVCALDAQGLERVLTRSAAVLGMSGFLEGVLGPLFRRIGEEWHEGRLRVAHEHMATAVAAPLVARLGRVVPPPPGAPGLVVATPAGERHEIGALMVAGIAAVEGWRVTYLGADVPAPDLAESAADTGARAVALSSIHAEEPDALAKEVATLRALLPAGVTILMGGSGAASLESAAGAPEHVRLADLSALRGWLRGSSRAVAT